MSSRFVSPTAKAMGRPPRIGSACETAPYCKTSAGPIREGTTLDAHGSLEGCRPLELAGFHFDLARLDLIGFGHLDGQDAVLQRGLDRVVLDALRQANRPGESPRTPL